MKSLTVAADGTLSLTQMRRPKPLKHQALIEILSVGICGTDHTLLKKSFKGVDESDYPLVLGHEAVGRVVELGENVVSFKVGDVVMLPFVPEPISAEGVKYGSAWGAFSEFGIVEDQHAVLDETVSEMPHHAPAQTIVPESIDPVLAPVIVTLREVLTAIDVSNIPLDEPIAVVGSGPVAMTFVKLFKLLGAASVTAVVRSDEKAQLMSEFGADRSINTSNESLFDAQPEGGFGAVVDAVGSDSVMNEALTVIRDRGIIFAYGVPKYNSMNLDWSRAPYNWTLSFQQMPRKDEEGAVHDRIVAWVEDGTLDLAQFVSEIVPIDEAPAFFEKYMSGSTSKKIIFQF